MRDSLGVRQIVGTSRGIREGGRSTCLALGLLAALSTAACAPADTPRDPDGRTWIRNMWTGPAVLPQAEARPAPERSMAVGAPTSTAPSVTARKATETASWPAITAGCRP